MSSKLMQDIRSKKMNGFQIFVVGLCVLLNMLDGFDVLAVAFSAPGIMKEWQLPPEALGMLFSAGLVGMVIGALAIAPLADYWGRRTNLLICITILSIGMLGSAAATGPEMLAALRLFTGLGIGGMLASVNTLVAEYSSNEKRDFCLSIYTIGYPVGATLGGLFVAAFLIDNYGWRSVYLFGGIVSTVLIPLIYARIPESVDFLLYRRNDKTLGRVNAIMEKLGHAPLTELPPIQEVLPEEKVNLLSLFKGKIGLGSLQICAAYFTMMFTFYFLMNWIPPILVELGMSAKVSISGAVLLNVGGIVGGTLVGFLTTRYSLSTLAITSMLLWFVATVTFGFLPANLTLVMIVAFFIGFLMIGAMVTLYAIVPLIYPAQVRNSGTGLALGVGRLGATAGPYVAGLIIGLGWERSTYFVVLALPILASAAIVSTIKSVRGRARAL